MTDFDAELAGGGGETFDRTMEYRPQQRITFELTDTGLLTQAKLERKLKLRALEQLLLEGVNPKDENALTAAARAPMRLASLRVPSVAVDAAFAVVRGALVGPARATVLENFLRASKLPSINLLLADGTPDPFFVNYATTVSSDEAKTVEHITKEFQGKEVRTSGFLYTNYQSEHAVELAIEKDILKQNLEALDRILGSTSLNQENRKKLQEMRGVIETKYKIVTEQLLEKTTALVPDPRIPNRREFFNSAKQIEGSVASAESPSLDHTQQMPPLQRTTPTTQQAPQKQGLISRLRNLFN